MNKEWNLDILYSGFDDPKYSEDTELLTKEIEALNALSSDISNIEEEKLVSEYIAISEKLNLLASKLGIFANLKYSANTKDSEAASALGRLMGLLSATAAPSTKISQAIAQISDLDAIIAKNPTLDEYRYMLNNIQRDSKHLLSDKEEELFAKMNISGMYTTAFLTNDDHRQNEAGIQTVEMDIIRTKPNSADEIGKGEIYGEFWSFGPHANEAIVNTITLYFINGDVITKKLNDLSTQIKTLTKGGEIIVEEVIEIKGPPGGFQPGVGDWDNPTDVEIIL